MANSEHFIKTVFTYYRLIQSREGDEGLRRSISAARWVWDMDRQVTSEDRTDVFNALRLVEETLLPCVEEDHDADATGARGAAPANDPPAD